MQHPKTFEQIKAGEWHKPKMKNYFVKCCDCGLVHKVDFMVVDAKTENKIKGAAVVLRAYRVD